MSDWDQFGGDPVRIDPARVRAFAAHLATVQATVEYATAQLTAGAGQVDSVWNGGSDSAAFTETLTAPLPLLRRMSAALDAARAAASTFAAVLEEERHQADVALASARAAPAGLTHYRYQCFELDPYRAALRTDFCAVAPPAFGTDDWPSVVALTRSAGEQIRQAVAAAEAAFVAALEALRPDVAAWAGKPCRRGAVPPVASLRGSVMFAIYEESVAALVADGPPRFPADPSDVLSIWTAMDPSLREAYLEAYPEVIGQTAGIPVADRSRANATPARGPEPHHRRRYGPDGAGSNDAGGTQRRDA